MASSNTHRTAQEETKRERNPIHHLQSLVVERRGSQSDPISSTIVGKFSEARPRSGQCRNGYVHSSPRAHHARGDGAWPSLHRFGGATCCRLWSARPRASPPDAREISTAAVARSGRRDETHLRTSLTSDALNSTQTVRCFRNARALTGNQRQARISFNAHGGVPLRLISRSFSTVSELTLSHRTWDGVTHSVKEPC
jgi:hypothetical protein